MDNIGRAKEGDCLSCDFCFSEIDVKREGEERRESVEEIRKERRSCKVKSKKKQHNTKAHHLFVNINTPDMSA